MSEFKITGPGKYRTQKGEMCQIGSNKNGIWRGVLPDGFVDYWTDGRTVRQIPELKGDNIIGPWVEPELCPKSDTSENRIEIPVELPAHGAVEPVKTLRDEVALAVLTKILSVTMENHPDNGYTPIECAEKAIAASLKVADLYMAARQKGGAA